METVKLHFRDGYAIVEINRPKANALNIELVQELIQALDSVATADSVRGAILTGTGTFFSAGLDIREMLGYNENQVDHFWDSFGHLVHDLTAFPKPLVAAINGHAPAGGCVLTLACDYRIMAEGSFRIGLNEISVGIVVPPPVTALAAFTVGNTKAARMFLTGTLFLPDEARDFGLIDEVCPHDVVLSWAEKRLVKLIELPATAWSATKATLRKGLLEDMDMPFKEGYGETVRAWWSKECRDALNQIAASLSKKAQPSA